MIDTTRRYAAIAAQGGVGRRGFGWVGLGFLLTSLVGAPGWAQVQRATNHVHTLAQRQALAKLARAHDSLANGVQATTVPLAGPAGMAYDGAGNLFLASVADNVIRKVDTAGMITTVAGTGEQGFAGDGGLATAAVLDSPMGVAVDGAGNVYVSDTHNQRVRRVDETTHVMTTVVGNGVAGFAGDGGSASAASLDLPQALAVDVAGNLYVADSGNHRVRKVMGASITTVAGNGDQGFEGDGVQATATGLDTPSGLAVDGSGNLYIADTHNQRVRLVTVATGVISTVAGNGTRGYAGDGGSVAVSVLDRPLGLSVDAAGNVYVADADNQRVRMLHAGTISTIAGDGEQGLGGDTASATQATLDTPRSTAVYGTTVAFADAHNDRARAVNAASGLVATVAGLDASSTAATLVLSGQASLVYGTAGTLTATFANQGNVATGKVTFLDGATVLGAANLSADAATVTLPLLGAGAHSIAASYVGDGTNPATTSGVFVLTVGVAGTTTSLSLSSGSVYFGAALTLTARVSGATTGTVAFLDGTTNVGNGAVQADGTATLKLATLSVGAHPLTAVYGATANYSGSNSAAVVATVLAVPDFALTAATATQTVTAGGTASFPLTVGPTAAAFTSPITFTVSGLPAGATVGFTPNGLAPNGSTVPVTMTVVTSPLVAAAQMGGGMAGMAAMILLLWPLMTRRRPRGFSQVTATLLLCLGVSGATAFLTGCGSSAGAQAKSYVLTVTGTATSVTGATLVHTATVNLMVN